MRKHTDETRQQRRPKPGVEWRKEDGQRSADDTATNDETAANHAPADDTANDAGRDHVINQFANVLHEQYIHNLANGNDHDYQRQNVDDIEHHNDNHHHHNWRWLVLVQDSIGRG